MPAVTRLQDQCTGHDSCPPKPLVTGSPNVFVNGKPKGRVTDKYESHGCVVHTPHQDEIAQGSSTVFCNGLSVARVGDSVSIGGSVQDGSPDVFAN